MSLLPPSLPTFVPDERYTLEQWQAIEESTGRRYEFHDGRLVSVEAMAGGSYLHSVLGSNLSHAVLTAFEADDKRHGRCSVASSDLRIAVDGGTRYLYADAVVVCGEPEYDQWLGSGAPSTHCLASAVVNPVVVFEVLSPSSEGYDRGRKFEFYGRLASLREYVLVEQDARRVEVRHRPDAGSPWRYTTVTEVDESVSLPSLDVALPLARVYRGWRPPES